MDLTIVKLTITVFEGAADLRDACLSGRGTGFEKVLFNTCCTRPGVSCQACPGASVCPLTLLTGRILSSDPELLRKHQKPGLPYIFESIHQSDESGYGDTFGVCLLGPSITYLVAFIVTLSRLVGTGAKLEVAATDYQGAPMVLQSMSAGHVDNLPLLSLAELYTRRSIDFVGCKRLLFRLLTRLRLVHDGREMGRFEPQLVLRAFIRRLTALCAYYGDRVDPDTVQRLIAAADTVTVARVVCNGEKSLVCHRGITGSYELTGDFELLGPLLSAGSLLHLGKGASYGMGAFSVSPIS